MTAEGGEEVDNLESQTDVCQPGMQPKKIYSHNPKSLNHLNL